MKAYPNADTRLPENTLITEQDVKKSPNKIPKRKAKKAGTKYYRFTKVFDDVQYGAHKVDFDPVKVAKAHYEVVRIFRCSIYQGWKKMTHPVKLFKSSHKSRLDLADLLNLNIKHHQNLPH